MDENYYTPGQVVTIHDHATNQWFFSTEHCQELGDLYVPITHYDTTPLAIRGDGFNMEVEIINPDINFIPDWQLEELTKPN